MIKPGQRQRLDAAIDAARRLCELRWDWPMAEYAARWCARYLEEGHVDLAITSPRRAALIAVREAAAAAR